MFKVAESAAKLIVTLRQTVLCLLAMFELTEGDTRDVIFVQALPNELSHSSTQDAQVVLTGYYTAELKGALVQTNLSLQIFTKQTGWNGVSSMISRHHMTPWHLSRMRWLHQLPRWLNQLPQKRSQSQSPRK